VEAEKKLDAWILWKKYTFFTNSSFEQGHELIRAFPSYKFCMKGRHDKWEKDYNLWAGVVRERNKDPKEGERSLISRKECCKLSVFFISQFYKMDEYLCLPETLDPRK